MNCGIYRIVNTTTTRTYIGSSIRIRKRLKDHRWALNRGNHSNAHLQASWIKYGAQTFTFESLVECSEESLEQREQSFIDAYIEHDLPLYNLKPSADPRSTFRYRATAETKAKQSAAFKGKSTAPLPAETKAKISAALKGRVFTPEHLARTVAIRKAQPQWHSNETRVKISRANKGKRSRLGAVLTEETKRKIGEANRVSQLGRKHTEETKRKIGDANRRRNLKLDALGCYQPVDLAPTPAQI